MDYLIACIGGYYCYRGQSHHDQVMDNIAEESDRLMTLFQQPTIMASLHKTRVLFALRLLELKKAVDLLLLLSSLLDNPPMEVPRATSYYQQRQRPTGTRIAGFV